MFDREVLEIEQEMTRWRRHLHMHPELSFEEYATTAFIEEKLHSFGNIEVLRPTKTGVVGRLSGTKPGIPHVLGIRADIDALPMREENDLPYRSVSPNAMHSCGHDGHAAMLLAAAALLSTQRDSFCGEVRFIFQHAEELPPGGAIELVNAGAADSVDMMLGLHLSSNYPVGMFGVRSGALTAAVDSFKLEIIGKGGHCAYPEQTTDPIVIAGQIILALQTIVSRRIPAVDAAVLSICKIQGGTAYNIIPDTVVLEGAVRSFSEETRELIEAELHRICETMAGAAMAGAAMAGATIADAARARCAIEYSRGYDSVVNDAELTGVCENTLLTRFGKDRVERIERIMPGEDFSCFTRGRPGFFVELGTKNAEKLCDMPHHNSAYRMDEDALRYGLQYYLDAVKRLLNGVDAVPKERK